MGLYRLPAFFRHLLVIALSTVAFTSCASQAIRRIGVSFSDALELMLSGSLAESITKAAPIVSDKEATSYLDSLANAIGQNSPRSGLAYRTYIVDSDEINAFTVGGGHLFLNKGLIARSRNESELSGVIAHEIGHNVGRHITKSLIAKLGVGIVTELARGENPSQSREIASSLLGLGGALFALKLSRGHEGYADSLAVVELVSSRIDPLGLPSFFGLLKDFYGDAPAGIEMYFADHPPLGDRIKKTEQIIAGLPSYKSEENFSKDSERFQAMRKKMLWLNRYLGVDTFVVDPGEVRALRLEVNLKKADSIFLHMDLKITGGMLNDIKLIVTDSTGFARLKRDKYPGREDFVKRVSSERIRIPALNHRKYHIIFDNSISVFSKKEVVARVYLRYKAI